MKLRSWALAALPFVVLGALGLWFVHPAWIACGAFPAPLDDVYIHASFARALAHGHPFSWVAGQGYSSGETAPLYPVLLAPAFFLGLDDESVVAFAFAVAIGALGLSARRVAELFGSPREAYSVVAGTLIVALAAAVGTVAFTFFSGMEAAAFFAASTSALVWVERARARPRGRKRAAMRAGLWGAAMVLLRPEAVVVVAPFALVAARGARSRPWLPMLARAALPGALATGLVLGLNYAFTGDFASAGARLKLLGSNPFLDDVARAKELVLNLFGFVWRVLAKDMGGPALLGLAALTGLGLTRERTRHPVLACLTGACAFALLVSTNGAARYQGFRYYAPAVALLVLGACLGLAGRSSPRRSTIALVSFAGLFALVFARTDEARSYFRRASKNVHEQQVTMGRLVSAILPRDAIVLVGDAGAIPFFSKRTCVDALGLGGYRRYPFVQAAVHGEAATLELLERIPEGERPTHFALYPNWFPTITGTFGRKVREITIEDNVICGGPTKVLYEADFSALGGGEARDLGVPPSDVVNVMDSLDLADVESERAHDTVLPVPNGGYTTARVFDVGGRRTFDGGRIVQGGREVSFVPRGVSGPARVTLRGDEGGLDVDVRVGRGECRATAEPAAGFTYAACSVEVHEGDRVTLAARREGRTYHVWISRP